MPVYGIVVEGFKDVGVYSELIRKVLGIEVQVVDRVAGDRAQLMKRFPGQLRSLEHVAPHGGPADKALVIRDADRKGVSALESEMHGKIEGRWYPFPNGVSVHAVREEMETWLLADPSAVSLVATRRGGRSVRGVRGPLENVQQPAARFQEMLSEARLNYTPEVCREIASEINLATLRTACPSFAAFEQKVLDP